MIKQQEHWNYIGIEVNKGPLQTYHIVVVKKFHSQCEQTVKAFHIGATHRPNQKHTRKRNNSLASRDAGNIHNESIQYIQYFVRNLYIFNLSSSSSYFDLKKFSKIVPHRSKMHHWMSDIPIPCWSTQYMYTLRDKKTFNDFIFIYLVKQAIEP